MTYVNMNKNFQCRDIDANKTQFILMNLNKDAIK